MPDGDPKISYSRTPIRQLDETAINRIAAGEVVERPASAVKELVENALDAGAQRIDIDIAAGGKSLIRVTDDGHGIPAAELPLALCRHATSKIDGSDLINIQTFGFRGEALPSMAAVGRLALISRADGTASEIRAEGGKLEAVRPAALGRGTIVELRDLFFATPARLKFLRSDRAETQAIADTVRRLSLAEPGVAFCLRDASEQADGRILFRANAEPGGFADALLCRAQRILGKDFAANAVPLDAVREGFTLSGYAGLPTYSRGASVAQHIFVNNRPVKDRLLMGALRAAYSDFLSRDRHPAAALFVGCDPELVDVNVHPAKSEVRFREPGLVRGLMVSGIRHALAEAGHRASNTVSHAMLGAVQTEQPQQPIYRMDRPRAPVTYAPAPMATGPGFAEAAAPSARIETPEDEADDTTAPLGAARAQVHENYILAQTEDGIVIVDQHAAHERLVYEELKAQRAESSVPAQTLLIPDIVPLSQDQADQILSCAQDLAVLGLEIEAFGPGAVAVRATPAPLGNINAAALVADILDELADLGSSTSLDSRLDAVLSLMACHGSIRSGRKMRADEMNALLRRMEATPHSGQCNHGRPTYVELKLKDIERLFGRT